jgi:hypothetical protein
MSGEGGSEVLKALLQFETRARNLLMRVTQLAEYLVQLQQTPGLTVDWWVGM